MRGAADRETTGGFKLPGGDEKAALAALEEHEERVEHHARMEARFHLWQATKDPAHLTEARPAGA